MDKRSTPRAPVSYVSVEHQKVLSVLTSAPLLRHQTALLSCHKTPGLEMKSGALVMLRCAWHQLMVSHQALLLLCRNMTMQCLQAVCEPGDEGEDACEGHWRDVPHGRLRSVPAQRAAVRASGQGHPRGQQQVRPLPGLPSPWASLSQLHLNLRLPFPVPSLQSHTLERSTVDCKVPFLWWSISICQSSPGLLFYLKGGLLLLESEFPHQWSESTSVVKLFGLLSTALCTG